MLLYSTLQYYEKSMEKPPNFSRLTRGLKTVSKRIEAEERFPIRYPMKVQI